MEAPVLYSLINHDIVPPLRSGQAFTSSLQRLEISAKSLEGFYATGAGGSLTGVYRATLTASDMQTVPFRELAIKVLVPNAEARISESLQEINTVVAELRHRPRVKKNPSLIRDIQISSGLFADIATWCVADINAVEQYGQRSELRTHLSSVTLPNIELAIPEFVYSGVPKIKMEEWVNGSTLRQYALSGDQAIVTNSLRLIERATIQMLEHPIRHGTYYIHTDIHPGQFQVELEDGKPTGKLYMLDLSFIPDISEFSEKESQHFKLIRGLEYTEQRANAYLEYLFNLSINRSINRRKRIALKANIYTILAQELVKGGSKSEIVKRVLVYLRREGVIIPEKWTVLQKDIRQLQRMNASLGHDRN